MPARLRLWLTLLAIMALALAAAGSARPLHAQDAGPAYVPDLFGSGFGGCVNQPPPVIDASWQTSAPREGADLVLPGDSVQIGLRDKYGGPDDLYDVAALVIAPDGGSTIADTEISGSDWAYLTYPDDFAPAFAAATYPGVYTVIWETEDGFLTCDGFVVAGD